MLKLHSAGRTLRATLECVIGRSASWLAGLNLTQVFVLLVALAIVAPPGIQLANGKSKFLSPLRTELIPFGTSLQAPNPSSVPANEVRLSQGRLSLALAASFSTVPPIRHDHPLIVTTNYCYRSAAHSLALLRAPPLA